MPSASLQISALVAGDDIRQKLEFHHVHLELGALGYIETFLFYWSWGFFQNNPPPRPIFVFENTRDLKNIFLKNRLNFSIKANGLHSVSRFQNGITLRYWKFFL